MVSYFMASWLIKDRVFLRFCLELLLSLGINSRRVKIISHESILLHYGLLVMAMRTTLLLGMAMFPFISGTRPALNGMGLG